MVAAKNKLSEIETQLDQVERTARTAFLISVVLFGITLGIVLKIVF